MNDVVLAAYVWQQTARAAVRSAGQARLERTERGEGVISAAIAVLVMAFLGVLMWQLFKDTLTKSNSNVNTQIDQIK